jgi:hypothetical protein
MTIFLDESNPLLQMKKFKELMHEVTVNPLWMSNKQAHQYRWDPYSNEGGYVFVGFRQGSEWV